jgi:hypothetical protein
VRGFVTLAPYLTCEDEVVVSYTSGSASVARTNDKFDERFIGKYLYIDDAWKKITAVTLGVATINGTPSHTGITTTKVVTMNDIVITGDNITLTTLEADYFPMIV